MLTKIMKGVSMAALLLALLLRSSASYEIMLQMVVCVSSFLVLTQAVRARKYVWAAGFLAIAALFNPVVPMALSRRTFLWLDMVSLMTFLISLAALKAKPILSMPSITNRTPERESL